MLQSDSTEHPLQKWQEAIWLLAALLTPLFVNFWVEQQFEASKVWLLRTLVWLLALLWLGGRLTGQRQRALAAPIRHLVLFLSLILLLATLLSSHHTVAIFGTIDRAGGMLTQLTYLLLFYCVAAEIDARRSRQLLTVIILTAVPICLLALAQAAGWQPLPVLSDARTPLTTTLGRANFTGAYLAMLLPLTLAAARSTKGKPQRTAYLLLFGAEILVIGLTGARAAWIAAAAGMGIFIWLQHAPRWSRPVRWTSGLAGLATLAALLLLILQRGLAAGDSIAARWTIWQASLSLLWPRLWLGYGADTLELYFPSVYPPQLVYYQGRGVLVDRAHNWLLDWSLNHGLVALIIFIGLITLIMWAGWKRLLAAPDDARAHANRESLPKMWLAASMAAAGAQLAGNLFMFDVAATAVLFWLLLAVVTAASAGEGKRAGAPLPLWMRSAVFTAAVFLLGWAVWQSNVRPMLADMHSWRGTRALVHGNPTLALAAYEAAVQQQPRRATYHVAEALAAAQVGEFEQAERAMGRAAALRPADPVLYTQLAAIYAHQAPETPEKARWAYAAYDQAVDLAPTIGLTHQKYADFALRSGNGEAARMHAQRAVDLDATDGRAYGILGWAHMQAGNLPAARSAFEQALKWQPDSAEFQLGLATITFQQGSRDGVRHALTAGQLLAD